ncbi:hypothetical protein NX059_002314 [Plenodomus lindquistii]|nr:hypothetical protein NX059_002314 [Plenodomus lindquistii]
MALSTNCTAGALPFPTVFGAQILSIEASQVQNYTFPGLFRAYQNHGLLPDIAVEFCNVTVTHTHPGQNDTLHTQVWLPVSQPAWNGRLQMAGGGGWIAGLTESTYASMYGAITDGYATSSTDAGVSTLDGQNPEVWAIQSDGNIDMNALNNFGRKGIHDSALISKSIIASFYGRPAAYSYWSGCSGGGRQGLAFAQNFPDVFDGIVAAAPAINWPQFFAAGSYPGLALKEAEEMPHSCEYETLRLAALATCDGLDGLIDGVISYPDLCHFDPYTLVGSPATNCSSPPEPSTISRGAAAVMDSLWHGARTTDGTLLWPTGGYESNLTTLLLPTTCYSNGTCTSELRPLFGEWLRLFIAKDTNFDFQRMTRDEWEQGFRQGVREYSSILGMNDPDLTDLRKSGNKLLVWHGLADELIPHGGSRHYYDAVTQISPDVHSYFRLFEAPGVQHCFGGVGGAPLGAFEALVAWVENGTAPDFLIGTNLRNQTSRLCPYPQKPVFKGQSPEFSAEDFECDWQV